MAKQGQGCSKERECCLVKQTVTLQRDGQADGREVTPLCVGLLMQVAQKHRYDCSRGLHTYMYGTFLGCRSLIKYIAASAERILHCNGYNKCNKNSEFKENMIFDISKVVIIKYTRS